METFYRHMCVRHQVLIDAAKKPVGGQWNFDADNRKAWPGLPAEPADLRTPHDHSNLWAIIIKAGVNSFGEPNAARLAWPLNRAEALAQLDGFVEHVLPHFGDFQDAMSSKGWRLFHSLLSFALNVKMLNPREVVDWAEAAGRAGHAPMAAAEGCHYDKKQREGERACPFNALYWDFHLRHKDKLANNPRIGMVYRQLDKMSDTAVQSLQAQAAQTRSRINQL